MGGALVDSTYLMSTVERWMIEKTRRKSQTYTICRYAAYITGGWATSARGWSKREERKTVTYSPPPSNRPSCDRRGVRWLRGGSSNDSLCYVSCSCVCACVYSLCMMVLRELYETNTTHKTKVVLSLSLLSLRLITPLFSIRLHSRSHTKEKKNDTLLYFFRPTRLPTLYDEHRQAAND